jgi:hypothetical protein
MNEEVPSMREAHPNIPELLDQVVRTCLARDRDQRFLEASTVQEKLLEFLAEEKAIIHTSTLAEFVKDLFQDVVIQGPNLDRAIFIDERRSPADQNASMETTQRFELEADLEEAEGVFSSAVRRKRIIVIMAALFIVILGILLSANELRKGVKVREPVSRIESATHEASHY